ncbi:YqiA/YcfP family alpha/beta fold hydrolase [Arsukibacterium sp.]|uniref:YqiA/YcfP family alpha/beta fold hydrolase n=1 Tax=Arsukibacterium sp. TaxID=1977258 RepID=UPI002FDB2F4D
MSNTIYYLHGFASSSLSEKAQQTVAYFQQQQPQLDLVALDLPYTPAEAMHLLEQKIAEAPPLAFNGSSLGGFLATVLVERFGGRACLINPAVAPHSLLADYLGDYHHPVLQRSYQVRAEHMQQLAALMPAQLRQPQNYLVLLQSGDEVLDYRHAQTYYQGAQQQLVAGGDHSFVGYADYLPQIAEFCQQADVNKLAWPEQRI